MLRYCSVPSRTLRLAVLVTLCSSLFIMSCDTTTPSGSGPLVPAADSAVMVVNQGSFGSDNASLSRIRPSGDVDASWFSSVNASRKLGGTANDIAFKGDTAFISVTKSHAIEVINAKTGVHLGTMLLSVTQDPWDIEIISPTLACVSTTNGDGVQFFNPSTLSLMQNITTGPATQGVTSTSSLVFVANSGYGTLRDTVAGAGTVSVIDISKGTVVASLNVGKNVTEVAVSNDNKRLYAYYQELYTNPDAKQGVVEYDVATLKETRRWLFSGSGYMNVVGDKIYVVGSMTMGTSSQNILVIDSKSGNVSTAMTIPSSVTVNGLTVDKKDGSFWVCDAGDYASNGKAVHFSATGMLLKSYSVGLIPVRIVRFP